MLVALPLAMLLAAAPAQVAPSEVQAAIADARSMDLSHSVEVARYRERFLARRAAMSQLGSAPGVTVSDIGRVTVLRDASGAIFGDGQSFSDALDGSGAAVDAFFAARPDSDADFVVIIQDWFNWGFPGAFYFPLENDATGIGYQHSHGTEVFDDDALTPIEGYLWLNGVDAFYSELFTGILWGQEFGHRWGAFVNVDTGGGLDDAILGRQSAHWSWYLDSDWSWMEGNDWIDNGDGTWTTNDASFDGFASHYHPLDLYLMGLATTAEVPAFTLLVPAVPGDASAAPEAWDTVPAVTITATPRVLTVQDVIAAEGPRVPAAGPTSFDVAVIYALRSGDRADAADLAVMEDLLDSFAALFTADTLGRASVSFGIAGTANAPPALAAIDGPLSVRAGKKARFDAGAATDPEGEPLSFSWRWDAEDDAAEFEPGDASQGHTFHRKGPRTIEVSVRDAGGAEVIVPFQIEVTPGEEAACCYCTIDPARTASPLAGLLVAAAIVLARRARQPSRAS